MTAVTHPTPQQIRDWMNQRQVEKKPPPTPEQIRMELSWHMDMNSNKAPECAR